MYDVILELPSQCTVEDCIIQATKYLNNQLRDLQYQIPEKAHFYEVFHAKKNGLPKDDYPCKIGILIGFYWIFWESRSRIWPAIGPDKDHQPLHRREEGVEG